MGTVGCAFVDGRGMSGGESMLDGGMVLLLCGNKKALPAHSGVYGQGCVPQPDRGTRPVLWK